MTAKVKGPKTALIGASALAFSAFALSACGSSKDPVLMNIQSNSGSPDEFVILPTKPLEMPEDLAALPEPTPGQSNRVDVDPFADVAVALGGKAPGKDRTVPAADGALLAATTQNGSAENIRTALAEEDLEFRKRNRGRLLERLFNVNTYFKAYRGIGLNQTEELGRWRAAGARNPSAPPAEQGEE